MKKLTVLLACSVLIIVLFVSCEKETVLIERTVNAVWSADDSEILKIVSVYETTAPEEVYYSAPSGKNWEYRFEICNPDLTECIVVGHSADILQGGTLEYVPLYWLPKNQKICTINPFNRAVLKDLQGEEQELELPADIANVIFEATGAYYDAVDLAPSPDEDIIAVYFWTTYLAGPTFIDYTNIHCISFFDAESGNHISTVEFILKNGRPLLELEYQNYNQRDFFLWSNNCSGVYIVTQDKAYFIGYASAAGIVEADEVPERPITTNSGKISNQGQLLLITSQGNNTILEIVQIDDWKAFDLLQLIPLNTVTYCLY